MNEIVEIDEAIDAGNELLDEIEDILAELKKATAWGVIDMFSDRSFFSSMLKHSSLHKAQEGKERLAYLISRFNDELDDVRVFNNLEDIAMSTGIEFCDFMFDGFLIDALTLSKIHDSRSQLMELWDNVNSVVNDLEKLKELEEY